MQKIDLEVQPRDLGRDEKITPSQIRREGYIPAVLYGHGDPVKIAVDIKAFKKATHRGGGTSSLFTVKLGETSALTVVKEIQRDIFSQDPIHVDFQRIDLKEKLELTIPIHLIGEAPGVKISNGILQHLQREIRIECLPDDIPPSIDIDLSGLELHKSVKVGDLAPPKGVEILTPGDHVIVSVIPPKAEEETPKPGLEGEAGAAAQPEVITKGKKDEEGAAPAAGSPAPAEPGDKKKGKS